MLNDLKNKIGKMGKTSTIILVIIVVFVGSWVLYEFTGDKKLDLFNKNEENDNITNNDNISKIIKVNTNNKLGKIYNKHKVDSWVSKPENKERNHELINKHMKQQHQLKQQSGHQQELMKIQDKLKQHGVKRHQVESNALHTAKQNAEMKAHMKALSNRQAQVTKKTQQQQHQILAQQTKLQNQLNKHKNQLTDYTHQMNNTILKNDAKKLSTQLQYSTASNNHKVHPSKPISPYYPYHLAEEESFLGNPTGFAPTQEVELPTMPQRWEPPSTSFMGAPVGSNLNILNNSNEWNNRDYRQFNE